MLCHYLYVCYFEYCLYCSEKLKNKQINKAFHLKVNTNVFLMKLINCLGNDNLLSYTKNQFKTQLMRFILLDILLILRQCCKTIKKNIFNWVSKKVHACNNKNKKAKQRSTREQKTCRHANAFVN